MKGRLLFLGTGSSVGVPVIGCSCAVCSSASPYNQRLRPSVLIQTEQKKLLIDPGPDFRQQALRHHITMLDGILLTHAHHDHTSGVDDLRPIYYRRENPLPALLSEETALELQMRYYYIFRSEDPDETFVPRIQLQILPPQREGSVDFIGLSIGYMTYEQGGMLVNGFRFGDLAYLSDIRLFSHTLFEQLQGIKTLIISALRHTPSPLHFSVDEAVDFAHRTKAERVWLTHLSHELDHEKTNAYLPDHIKLAYDGLEIEFGNPS
ncbi:MBL fold metallo-hydrolase [Candidatus Protochlamydia phocaeensis]|uniref:MBL fold metallo-hydrolase n=1 Tax=Candidatus Protochlamydia phocaeensis TaxID=1414722 RepID=UPI0008391FBC|nr:MBL fold metallo-hydrolase [Candidatus Protochlamydia phocaeensis]